MASKKDGAGKATEEEEFVPKLESAAQEAAVADGLIPGEAADSKVNKKPSLRRGKWTTEEESYANRLIYEFKLGLLPLTDGTTLRTFLSKLLNCDPMRISKKFVGQNCIGKQVFRRRQQDLEKLTSDQIETSRRELAELERKFLERVAQTNRSKSGGVKEGKGYEDENGNPILAPWMMPPDETGELSARAAAAHHHAATNRTQPAFPGDSSSYGHNIGQNFPQPHSSKALTFPARNDMTPIDYHMFNQSNPALMSQMMHPNGMPTYAYYPAPYAMPHHLGGRPGDYAGNEDARMSQAALLESLHRSGNYPIGWLPPSSSSVEQPASYADMRPAASSNGNTANSGIALTQDWPSMGSLFGGGGESMENIAQFLAHYQSQNSDSMLHLHDVEGLLDRGKELETLSASKQRGEDVGLSLDDSTAPNSTSKNLTAVKSNLFSNSATKPISGKWQDRLPTTDSIKSESTTLPYTIPHGMAAMAQLYTTAGGHDDSRLSKLTAVPVLKTEQKSNVEASTSAGTTSSEGASMPRNSSIENFWMLVNMGDLPRPDQGVLSEVVFDYPKVPPKPNALNEKGDPVTHDSAAQPSAGKSPSSSSVSSKAITSTGNHTSSSQTKSSSSSQNDRSGHQGSVGITSATSPSSQQENGSAVTDETRIGKKRPEIHSHQGEDEYGLSLEDDYRNGDSSLKRDASDAPLQKKIKIEDR